MATSGKTPLSALELVGQVDSWPYFDKDPQVYRNTIAHFYYLMVKGYPKPFGHIHESYVKTVEWPESFLVNHEKRFVTLNSEPNFQSRTKALNAAVLAWKKDPKSLSGEQIPLYYPETWEHVADVDRASIMGLFGIIDCAVHVVICTVQDGEKKYWIARRGPHKRLWPNLLDNAVTGGIPSGESPIEAVIRESREEANLKEDYTRDNAKFVRKVSYSPENILNLEGGVMHHCLYVYELEIPPNVFPTPNGEEVANYKLYTLDQVREAISHQEFMPILTMTWTAYFIHVGLISPENEKDYAEINKRISRKFDFFVLDE